MIDRGSDSSEETDVRDVPPLIKICGLTTPEQARQAVSLGAHWIGLNCFPRSKRFVTPDQAARICDALPDRGAAVALFVDTPADRVIDTCRALGISTIQLHGDEPLDDIVLLRWEGFRVVRAFRLSDPAGVDRMLRLLAKAAARQGLPDAVLIDAEVPGQVGGTGQQIPRAVLERLAPHVDSTGGQLRLDAEGERVPWILAGGLRPDNLKDALLLAWPWMVDVASGVESAPGQKDPALITAFVAAARGAPRPRGNTESAAAP